jgi:hypothetical protein
MKKRSFLVLAMFVFAQIFSLSTMAMMPLMQGGGGKPGTSNKNDSNKSSKIKNPKTGNELTPKNALAITLVGCIDWYIHKEGKTQEEAEKICGGKNDTDFEIDDIADGNFPNDPEGPDKVIDFILDDSIVQDFDMTGFILLWIDERLKRLNCFKDRDEWKIPPELSGKLAQFTALRKALRDLIANGAKQELIDRKTQELKDLIKEIMDILNDLLDKQKPCVEKKEAPELIK